VADAVARMCAVRSRDASGKEQEREPGVTSAKVRGSSPSESLSGDAAGYSLCACIMPGKDLQDNL
jgi:hypothetical protein